METVSNCAAPPKATRTPRRIRSAESSAWNFLKNAVHVAHVSVAGRSRDWRLRRQTSNRRSQCWIRLDARSIAVPAIALIHRISTGNIPQAWPSGNDRSGPAFAIVLALPIGNWTGARCQDQLAPVAAPGSTVIFGTALERSNAHPSSASILIGRAPLGRRLSFSDFGSTVSQSLAWGIANGAGDPIGCGLAPRGMPCTDAAQGLAALWVPVSGVDEMHSSICWRLVVTRNRHCRCGRIAMQQTDATCAEN